MSSKMDARERGKEAPLTKPKVEGGYRRRCYDPIRENKKPSTTRPARVNFSGLTEDLKGHINDVSTGYQADQFKVTTKVLASSQ